MKPKYKLLLLLLVLGLPYFGFVGYIATRFPQSKPAPMWCIDTLLVWFTANFLIFVFVGKRIMRGQAVDPEKARAAAASSANIASRLVVFWIVLFLYGVVETVHRKVPLNRAIPAGVFLLFFIGLFGLSAYRTRRADNSEGSMT